MINLLSYPEEFKTLLNSINKKYKINLLEKDGIGEQLDVNNYSKKFFSKAKSVADVSIDANANVESVSLIQYHNEMVKPLHKLNSLYLLWKYSKELYNTEFANKVIEAQLSKTIYIHDSNFIQFAYCFNFSAMDVVCMGLPNNDKLNSNPPNNLSSFMGQMINFITEAGNNIMGAVGVADLLICAAYYVEKLRKENSHLPKDFLDKQIKQELQSFIYSINRPFRGGVQSFFVNISLYDNNFLDKLCSEYQFPNGSLVNKETVKELQQMYVDLMNSILERSPITFPVTTACFSINEDKKLNDTEFLKFVAKANTKYAFINIYQGKTSSLSSCCFHKDTKVLCKSSNLGIIYDTFENIEKMKPYDNYKKNFTIFHNGSWCKGNLIKTTSDNLYRVITENNKEIIVTGDHINVTLSGNKETKDLTEQDYLMFNNLALNSFPEKDEYLTYEQGFVIGLYAGDGSVYSKCLETKGYESNSIIFSLNADTDKRCEDIISSALKQWNISAKINKRIEKKLLTLAIYSMELKDIIKSYVFGNYCYEKSFNPQTLLQSKEFRQGIIDGWYQSDGGNSNRIYSTSEKLVETGELIFTSLGIATVISEEDRIGKIVIRGSEFNRNYISRCIRWYDQKNKRSMGDVYKVHNNSTYFKIKSITKLPKEMTDVYCFEMKNVNEPYFTLPNGIITHNCRLRSSKENLGYANSFGSGSSKIGSIGVCTINLPRLAKRSKNEEEFLDKLQYYTEFASKINHVKRYIIKKRIDSGHYPLYTEGYMELKKQYSTCGLIGINECCKNLKKEIMTKEGQQLTLDILDIVNKVNAIQEKKYKYPHNCEQVPGESVSIKLAEIDRELGYNDEYTIYSNQFIPLTSEADLYDRIKLQGMFDHQMTGGAICHLNISDRVSEDFMEKLITKAVEEGVVYFAVNYNLQACEDKHLQVGKTENCQVCGKPIVNNYTRIVGFLVNTKNWHPVRRELDYPNRKWYNKERNEL